MDSFLLSGSLLQRDQSVRDTESKPVVKDKTLKEVIESASKEIEAVFVSRKPKVQARAKAA